jgi:hypothetical protein
MDSQKIAGLLAGLIGLAVFAVAFTYLPKKGADVAKQPVERPQAAAPKAPPGPPVRGPVVRDVTPEK